MREIGEFLPFVVERDNVGKLIEQPPKADSARNNYYMKTLSNWKDLRKQPAGSKQAKYGKDINFEVQEYFT
jgi:hypothetical protein